MNVITFKDGKVDQVLLSINGAEYMVDPQAKKGEVVAKEGCIIDPDLSQLKDVPQKYWKQDGNSIVEMDKSEKQEVDALEKQIIEQQKNNLEFIDIRLLISTLIKKGVITKEDLLKE